MMGGCVKMEKNAESQKLFDEGQKLSGIAYKLFIERDYKKARVFYQNALSKYENAVKYAQEIENFKLAKEIESYVKILNDRITECEILKDENAEGVIRNDSLDNVLARESKIDSLEHIVPSGRQFGIGGYNAASFDGGTIIYTSNYVIFYVYLSQCEYSYIKRFAIDSITDVTYKDGGFFSNPKIKFHTKDGNFTITSIALNSNQFYESIKSHINVKHENIKRQKMSMQDKSKDENNTDTFIQKYKSFKEHRDEFHEKWMTANFVTDILYFSIGIGTLLFFVVIFSILFGHFEGAPFILSVPSTILFWFFIYPYFGYRMEKKDYENKRKLVELKKWKQTTPCLFDTAQKLSKEAEKSFAINDYKQSRKKYKESLNNFISARKGAETLADDGLAKAIDTNIYNSKKSILGCDNAIGVAISENANKLFDGEYYEKARDSYQKAITQFENAHKDAQEIGDSKLIEKIPEFIESSKDNLNNCEIALDKNKVESLFNESKSLYENAAELAKSGEVFSAKKILRDAELKINKAFNISTKRNFLDATSNLNLVLRSIRDEMNNIDENIANGVNAVEFDKNITKITVGSEPEVEIDKKLSANVRSTSYSDSIVSDLAITRETEFYQGFIRLKLSVANPSSFVINDVSLDFDYDDDLLRIDRHEPDYQIKKGKIILGNISANSSKTVAIYFDPMMCSKGTDINCQINYKDAKGRLQTTQMKPKKISVICPIMKTDSDINIGRLKEFIEQLSYRDSKVYQIQTGFDIFTLKNISREVIQKHNVKHIRTLFTKDGSICEIWYYGKTKVHSHDIVLKITVSSETQSIELFAATETAESLTGLLAEAGRELKNAIEAETTGKGNVQQVINVSIKDSIVQRSNLLSYCDIDGNCSGDVVIEDSLVTRSEIGLDAEVKDNVVQRGDVDGRSCPACGEVVPDGAKFCMECGVKLQ